MCGDGGGGAPELCFTWSTGTGVWLNHSHGCLARPASIHPGEQEEEGKREGSEAVRASLYCSLKADQC